MFAFFKKEDRRLIIRVRENSTDYSVSVIDNGPGVGTNVTIRIPIDQ